MEMTDQKKEFITTVNTLIAGKKRRKIAADMGISEGMFSLLSKGKRRFTPELLSKFALAVGLDALEKREISIKCARGLGYEI